MVAMSPTRRSRADLGTIAPPARNDICLCIAPAKEASVNANSQRAQIVLSRRTPPYWRLSFDNPPLNVMGPEMVRQFQALIEQIEADEDLKVVVFDSAVEGFDAFSPVPQTYKNSCLSTRTRN